MLRRGGWDMAGRSTALGPTRATVCFLKSGWTGWEREAVTPSRPGQRGRRKQLQRLGDCCLRLCADMWSMACFLWTAAVRPAPTKDRSKRSRAWARKAEELMAASPVQMTKDISIYRMSWLSKRHSVYARGARAAWTECQWWVEMTKEEESRRVGARGGRRWGRSGQR